MVLVNTIACCTPNSPIGLGLKYIKIPKLLKAKIFGAKKFSPKFKGTPYYIWSSIESVAILTLREEVIMNDETLSKLEPTGSEPNEETPTSTRKSFHGDSTQEDGELTVASEDQSVLQKNPFVIERFPA